MSLLGTWARLLTFRSSAAELSALSNRHLVAGLAATWLAGIGRYWDHPTASLFQHFGLGSVAYVFAMATLLWLVMAPLRPREWTWRRVLTFVTMTSPPALLYAVPVEQFLPMKQAAAVNGWFLAVVAAWRVALLFWFLLRGGGLAWWAAVPGTLLPLVALVVALALLNLERVVFDLMSGITQPSSNDTAYQIVLLLAAISFYAFVPLLVWWLGALVVRLRSGGGDPVQPA